MTWPVDVLAVLDAVDAVLCDKLARRRREFDKDCKRFGNVHSALQLQCDRDEYLRDEFRKARAAIADLAAANKAAQQAYGTDAEGDALCALWQSVESVVGSAT